MATDQNWQHVVVLGAAGKMGSGISLLLLQEMADMEGAYLTLLDANIKGFESLRRYLREHLARYAERNINRLRKKYAGSPFIDNGEIIEEFVMQAMDRVRCVTALEECKGAKLIFEAIVENVDIKAEVFRQLDVYTNHEAFYFTNTSSIPIEVLAEKSQLIGRLIGFHFYNPPVIQKLLELIETKNLDLRLQEQALSLAKRLNKTIVHSNDIAGFIGNGHFIREILGACDKVRELSKHKTPLEAIEFINRVTKEFMLRPMGIFQLIDYVGIDVCHHIAKIMSTYLGCSFLDPLIEEMVKANSFGGQNPDGSQKNGFFRYEKGVPVAIFDVAQKVYVSLKAEDLGCVPDNLSWKLLSKDPQKLGKIEAYFQKLSQINTPAAKLSLELLKHSQAIANNLVKDKVARSIEDVNTVLKEGFFHLYGVDVPFKILAEVGGKQ